MSTATDTHAMAVLQERRGIDDALAAWRGVAREQVVGALLLALVAVAPYAYNLGARAIARGDSLSSLWPAALGLTVAALVNAFTLLAALMLADRAVDRGAGRLRAYSIAVIAGVLVGTAAGWLLNSYVIGVLIPLTLPAEKFSVNPRAFFTVGLSRGLEWMTLGALATYVYADRREVRRIAALLQASQDRRLVQVRQQIESELLAMQARVEPQFLFDTLGHVQQLYENDAASAERMLDSLIAFLRAAMPEVRNTTSTLDQEIALAFAYVAIQSVRYDAPIRCTLDAPEQLRSAEVPPMTIVPMIDQAIGLQALGSDAAAEGTLQVGAVALAGRLNITIRLVDCRLPARHDPAGIDVLRRRLTALFGADADLAATRIDAHAAEATLAIPLRTLAR